MLEIFHSPRSRSMRVVWLAEEMGLPYELRTETFGQPSADFLAAGRTGAFPAIRDGDIAMGESVAIMHYLTEVHGPTPLALKPGHRRYAEYVQFLVFGEASMAAFLNPVLGTQFFAPEAERQNVTVDIAKRSFTNRLKAVEAQLDKADHVAGDFTAADISVGYALGLGAMVGLSESYSPKIGAYRERLESRPAYQAAASK
ncbi:MAG TPA: glutathione S-transferase family protein [Caulobacteraceae bacterium]|nr:glutathione S-transferase family protein [Caulobacteraceae bacterium]